MNQFKKRIVASLHRLQRDKNVAFLQTLQKKFPAAEVYLVGGMVRDIALGKPSQDYDFVIRNVPKPMLQKILMGLGTVNLVGTRFGVFKFRPKNSKLNEHIDIALPRTEHSFHTGAYKDFIIHSDFTLPIEKDLERRDFTINALALKVKFRSSKPRAQSPEFLIDPFGGLDDVSKKIIRAVGLPSERFSEDYSRILRAIRFSCQLDFEIETSTWTAIQQNVKKVNETVRGHRVVPMEVISSELVKALWGNPTWAVELLDSSGVFSVLIPELLKMKKCEQPKEFHVEGDVWVHTVLALNHMSSKSFHKEFRGVEIPRELAWSILFHDIGKPYKKISTDRIHFPGHDVKGTKLFRSISQRLKLSSAGLRTDDIEKVISKHMFLAYSDLKTVKETTFEKYFFSELFPGLLLQMLMYCDVSASIHTGGKPNFTRYTALKKRLRQLQKKTRHLKRLPPALLNGNEIMKILNIPPGPKIQRIKDYLRELQLRSEVKTKVQAKKRVKEKFLARQ